MERRNPSSAPPSSRADRKTIERNRRNHMKHLFSTLNSLVQHQSSREPAPLPDQLEEAAKYIKRMQINLEKLREKKQKLLRVENLNSTMRSGAVMNRESWLPRINIHQIGLTLEVNLLTPSTCYNYQLLSETVRTLEEEGAEVVSASFSVVGIHVFQTVHSEVQDTMLKSTHARISERLQKMICIGYQ